MQCTIVLRFTANFYIKYWEMKSILCTNHNINFWQFSIKIVPDFFKNLLGAQPVPTMIPKKYRWYFFQIHTNWPSRPGVLYDTCFIKKVLRPLTENFRENNAIQHKFVKVKFRERAKRFTLWYSLWDALCAVYYDSFSGTDYRAELETQ